MKTSQSQSFIKRLAWFLSPGAGPAPPPPLVILCAGLLQELEKLSGMETAGSDA